MLNILKIIALFAVASVCHWGFATLFLYWGLNVNFMLVFAIAFCALAPLEYGYPMAFVCGLFLDFFGVKLFGNNAFSFTVAACLVYALRERIDFTGFLPQMAAVFVLTIGVGVLNSLLLIQFTSASLWPGTFSLVGGALVGAVLSPLVFGVVRFFAPEASVEEYP